MTFPDTSKKNIVGDSDRTSAVQLTKLAMTTHNGNNKSFHSHHIDKHADKSVILILMYKKLSDIIF